MGNKQLILLFCRTVEVNFLNTNTWTVTSQGTDFILTELVQLNWDIITSMSLL